MLKPYKSELSQKGMFMPYSTRINSFTDSPFKSLTNSRGFTLVEFIVGIVVLSMSLSIISTLIVPAEEKSADQILQVKAAELGQSLLNDITSRAFDHNSDMAGGRLRCGENKPDGTANPCSTTLGRDIGETTRDQFNDVDDFNGYTAKFNANNDPLANGYSNFQVRVRVELDGIALGLANADAKKITVSVITPLGTEIVFATHKANF